MPRPRKHPVVMAAPLPQGGGIVEDVDAAGIPLDASIPASELPVAPTDIPDFEPPVFGPDEAIDITPTLSPKRAAALEARCDRVNSRNVQNVDGDFDDDEFDELVSMRQAAKHELLEATQNGNHQARMEALLHYVGTTMVDCNSARDLGCFVTNYARISRDLAAIDKTKERRQNIAQARNRKRKRNRKSVVNEKQE